MDTKGGTMIPLGIDDPEVLRRTLEELETKIPVLELSAQTILTLDDTATLADLVSKANEQTKTVNAILKSLDGGLRLK